MFSSHTPKGYPKYQILEITDLDLEPSDLHLSFHLNHIPDVFSRSAGPLPILACSSHLRVLSSFLSIFLGSPVYSSEIPFPP